MHSIAYPVRRKSPDVREEEQLPQCCATLFAKAFETDVDIHLPSRPRESDWTGGASVLPSKKPMQTQSYPTSGAAISRACVSEWSRLPLVATTTFCPDFTLEFVFVLRCCKI